MESFVRYVRLLSTLCGYVAAALIGLGILTLQSIADLLSLINGRDPPFGIRVERRS